MRKRSPNAAAVRVNREALDIVAATDAWARGAIERTQSLEGAAMRCGRGRTVERRAVEVAVVVVVLVVVVVVVMVVMVEPPFVHDAHQRQLKFSIGCILRRNDLQQL